MARMRMVKPEFFDDPDIAELSFQARLFFIGLWLQADKDGRLEDSPRRLKVRIFPYDDVDVEELLVKLHERDMIRRYISRHGMSCIWIRSFTKHQRPHPNETTSVIPKWEDRDESQDERFVKLHDGSCNKPSTCSCIKSKSYSDPKSESEVGNQNTASPPLLPPEKAAKNSPPLPPPSRPSENGHQAVTPRPRSYGRITLHRWQIDELIQALGPLAEDFGLDVWIHGLSASADEQKLLLDKKSLWPWVQTQLKAECERRGLRVAGAEPDPQSEHDAIVKRRTEILRREFFPEKESA